MQKKALLIIDVQPQFSDKNGNYQKCLDFISEKAKDYDMVLGTVFVKEVLGMNGKIKENSLFRDKLKWKEYETDFDERKVEYSVDSPKFWVLDKCGCSTNFIPNYIPKDFHIDIIGCNTVAGIIATSLMLWDEQYDFSLLTDYIYTNADDYVTEKALFF